MEYKKINTRRKSAHLQEVIAKNILMHRKNLSISQEEMAERLGYHRTYIGSVERAERNITIATLQAFADFFSIEPYELLISHDD